MKQPRLVRGENPGEYCAQFASGAAVQLRAERTRRYPGLKSTAPDTESIYRRLLLELPRGGKALDVGAGAGVGTASLASHFDRVIGVDNDARAVAFAKALVPHVAFQRADATTTMLVGDAQVVTLIDVLGQVREPLAVLRTIRRQIRTAGVLFVAEPRAQLTQELRGPVRRAYTTIELEQLLDAAGFQATAGTGSDAEWVGCFATRRAGDGYCTLEAGEAAWHVGNYREALRLLDEAAAQQDPVLAREACLRVAMLHEELGSLGEATARYLEVKLMAPLDPRAQALLARLLARLGRGFEALELARAAVELDPSNRIAVTCLAAVAEELEHTDAMSAWRLAHALAPDNEAVAHAYARHLRGIDAGDQARSVLARLQEFSLAPEANASLSAGKRAS